MYLLADDLYQHVDHTLSIITILRILEPWTIMTEIQVFNGWDLGIQYCFENNLTSTLTVVKTITEFIHIEVNYFSIVMDDLSKKSTQINSSFLWEILHTLHFKILEEWASICQP